MKDLTAPDTAPEMRGELKLYDDVTAFITAGDATFTVVSKLTGKRFTFRVVKARRAPEDQRPPVWWVHVLIGPDNTCDYGFLGTIRATGDYAPSPKSKIGPKAPSRIAWEWFIWYLTEKRDLHRDCEVWHEGACGRCGRKLTVPESIKNGFGPKCFGLREAELTRQVEP